MGQEKPAGHFGLLEATLGSTVPRTTQFFPAGILAKIDVRTAEPTRQESDTQQRPGLTGERYATDPQRLYRPARRVGEMGNDRSTNNAASLTPVGALSLNRLRPRSDLKDQASIAPPLFPDTAVPGGASSKAILHYAGHHICGRKRVFEKPGEFPEFSVRYPGMTEHTRT